MPLDDGIWRYEEGESASPTFSELLNRLGDSVRGALARLRPPGTATYDTGWLTLSSGTINVWARRVGHVVTVNVDMSTITGVTDDVVFIHGGATLIPVDMRPSRQVFGSGTADQPDITLHTAVLYVQPHGALAFVKSKLATRGLAGTATYVVG